MLVRHSVLVFCLAAAALLSLDVRAQAVAPDVLIDRVSSEVLDALKADESIRSTDVKKIIALVDEKVMPHVNFRRMTASAVGRYWRRATPEQQARLQAEFQTLLVRTYSGALSEVREQTIHLKPMRSKPGDDEVVVKTEVRGKGDAIQLDYRLEKSDDGWKIYDVNMLGVWLVQNYRNSFAQEIGANGIDSLIEKLAAKNNAAAARNG